MLSSEEHPQNAAYEISLTLSGINEIQKLNKDK